MNKKILAIKEKLNAYVIALIALLDSQGDSSDSIGKRPLAIQQLALAKFRAEDGGDTKLAAELAGKMRELLKDLVL